MTWCCGFQVRRKSADYDLLTALDDDEIASLLAQAQEFIEQSLDYLEANGYA